MEKKFKVLFLCTGNSCRSQMAEGWAKALCSSEVEAYSAGIETHGLNPKAVQVMQEVGIDISKQESKHVNILINKGLDLVVTVCDHASESCPIFPGSVKIIHHNFPDPPKLAAHAKTIEEELDQYRKVRDMIKDFIQKNPFQVN